MRFFLFGLFFLIASLQTLFSGEDLLILDLHRNVNHSHHPFVIHAIPKCGTHFIQRIIHLLSSQGIFNEGLNIESLEKAEQSGKILRIFTPWKPNKLELLKQRQIRLVAMIRDPRDALISNLFYMQTMEGKGVNRDVFKVVNNFDQLSLEDQLTSLMLGDQSTESYLNFYKKRMGWALHPYCLQLKYEDLVGSKGGGSDARQRKAINRLVDYLGYSLSEEKLQFVINNMYQTKENIETNLGTFIRGSIGNWKRFLTPEQKAIFKKILGNELIKLGYEKGYHW